MRSLLSLFAIAVCVIAQAQIVAPTPENTIDCGKNEITCLTISPRGDMILVGTADGAFLYDIEKGKKVQEYPYDVDGSSVVYYAAFNENGEYLVLIGFKGKRWLYNTKTAKRDMKTTPHKWIPDPRETAALGFNVRNSDFDRFYQQLEATHPKQDITAKAGKDGLVEFVDAEGKTVQKLEFPENKDVHHRSPCYFGPNEEFFITGSDAGEVQFYKLN